MRHRSQKTAETLLLDPTKNKEKPLQATRPNSRKRCLGRAAGFVPKPLRNRSRKNAETSLLEPIRKKEIYAQTMRNRSQKTAETLLLEPTKNADKRKMPTRCIWND